MSILTIIIAAYLAIGLVCSLGAAVMMAEERMGILWLVENMVALIFLWPLLVRIRINGAD